MERLAREKILKQQKLAALKKEINANWDHIDINSLLLEQNSETDVLTKTGKTLYYYLSYLFKKNYSLKSNINFLIS